MTADHDQSDLTPNRLPHPLSVTCEQWADACHAHRGGRQWATKAYKKLFREADSSELVEPWRGFDPFLPVVGEQVSPSDGPEGDTVKILTEIEADADGKSAAERDAAAHDRTLPVESVVIPMIGRTGSLTYTLCVSSQVGCAMGCEFCETAQMGHVKNLSPQQIVGQWFTAQHGHGATHGKRIKNIVFMGMGEPLDNADNVIQAIGVLNDRSAANIGMRCITVSTVGRVDGIWKLRRQCEQHGWRRLGVAISVNAPNDEIRDQIMPINKRWNMAELRDSLIDYPRSGQNRIMIEYVLIPGVNDRLEHADELAAWVEPLLCAVNVIPYNPRRDSPWPAPEERVVDAFVERLRSKRVFTKRRKTKGRDQMAACGQLGTEHIRGRKLVTLSTGVSG
ncbi:MAG: 23S rRNA (adenine(2503)-C(2))-methyltransferase RlmN [Planctomycetota bacterium]